MDSLRHNSILDDDWTTDSYIYHTVAWIDQLFCLLPRDEDCQPDPMRVALYDTTQCYNYLRLSSVLFATRRKVSRNLFETAWIQVMGGSMYWGVHLSVVVLLLARCYLYFSCRPIREDVKLTNYWIRNSERVVSCKFSHTIKRPLLLQSSWSTRYRKTQLFVVEIGNGKELIKKKIDGTCCPAQCNAMLQHSTSCVVGWQLKHCKGMKVFTHSHIVLLFSTLKIFETSIWLNFW